MMICFSEHIFEVLDMQFWLPCTWLDRGARVLSRLVKLLLLSANLGYSQSLSKKLLSKYLCFDTGYRITGFSGYLWECISVCWASSKDTIGTSSGCTVSSSSKHLMRRLTAYKCRHHTDFGKWASQKDYGFCDFWPPKALSKKLFQHSGLNTDFRRTVLEGGFYLRQSDI